MGFTKKVKKQTPVIFRGTGGLRKSSANEAKAILSAVGNVMKASGLMARGNFATIISGTDEAIFAWFSVNYLLGEHFHIS